jgi:hypothetical protein
MHGRAAAMVTPIGDKKTLLPAASAVSSSGCAGRGRLKSGSSQKKKWKHARLQGAQRREGVCVGLGCRGPECVFACFLRGDLAVLGANGDGAWPQAHIHLNLRGPPSGSPPTKFEGFVTVCNRHSTLVHQGCFTFSDNDSRRASVSTPLLCPQSAPARVARRVVRVPWRGNGEHRMCPVAALATPRAQSSSSQ